MKKIEHLGIAVNNIEASIKVFETLLGTNCYKIEEVASEFVKTAFLQIGESKIELLEATHSESPIAKFLEKKGRGIHHIAFDTTNLEEEIERLSKEGFELIHKSPKDGADGKIIAFLHPKSTDGILIELCQDKIM
ncbi:MAG: methylmalonyl-CoA epimerase [Flavobacteriia bacterium]|nr:methylmalonyl-CoA epimerase [Flavobacteriia bacterium]